MLLELELNSSQGINKSIQRLCSEMTPLKLLGDTQLEEAKHVSLIGAWDRHAKPLSHLFEEIFGNESTPHPVLSMRLKSQPIKLLDAHLVTLDNAYHFLKHLWFRFSMMITVKTLCIELFILIVIRRRLELLECAFGTFLSIHSLLSSIGLFALSIVVDVVDVSSENSVD